MEPFDEFQRQQFYADAPMREQRLLSAIRGEDQLGGSEHLGTFFLVLGLIFLPFLILRAGVERYTWAGLLFATLILCLSLYYLQSFLHTSLGEIFAFYIKKITFFIFLAFVTVIAIFIVVMLSIIMWKFAGSFLAA